MPQEIKDSVEPRMINFQGSHPLAILVTKLREDLSANGFIFGCLFLAEEHDDGFNFGLFFSDKMPKDIRLAMLNDLEKAVATAKLL